jgi:hypothetical protein
MTRENRIPRRLYKYRAFSDRALEALIVDQIFFADPRTFNDPLDTKPSLDADIDTDALAVVLARLVERRVTAEMRTAAKTLKTKEPATARYIEAQSRQHAEQIIADIRYQATNPEYDDTEDPARLLFGLCIEDELQKLDGKGIFCLAKRADCPLMWSHYGDQHNGVCIGYSVPARAAGDLYQVSYGGSRLIAASTVAAMLDGNDAARRAVKDAVLAKKACPWCYEHEWRLIGPRGSQNSPLELEEIVFGMRCSNTVKYTIVTALAGRSRPIKFYEMFERRGRFVLSRKECSTDELVASLPRRVLDVYDAFNDLSGNGRDASH